MLPFSWLCFFVSHFIIIPNLIVLIEFNVFHFIAVFVYLILTVEGAEKICLISSSRS